MAIPILQPHIPHYREEFFQKLYEKVSIKVYCYNTDTEVSNDDFQKGNFITNKIKTYNFGPFMWYNPLKILQSKSDTVVLMLDFKHIATWFLLLTKIFHKRRIIIWGQGISIKRYLKDEKKVLLILKWMLKLADGVWFYTEKEKQLWQKRIPNLNAVALNNTVSDIDKILKLPNISISKKQQLKDKHNINQPIVMLFCARFTADRRTDLLIEVINNVNPETFGFIIIGEGKSKPSFRDFKNVYDFGKVYNFDLKTELFAIADIYFQPAWLGLSVVEAMGYGKPVFSFKRSPDILQCVEYFYIKHGVNGYLFTDTREMVNYLIKIQKSDILKLSNNAKNFAKKNLSMDLLLK